MTTVRILDITGRLIQEYAGAPQANVHRVAGLTAGVYLVELTGKNRERWVERIVVVE